MLFKTQGLVFKDFLRYKDLYVKEDKVTFIVGKSGSGKTTLFRLFNNSVSPSSGCVFYRENNILDLKPLELRKKILLVSQEAFLFDGTIRDNFDRFAGFRQIPPFDTQQIECALNMCSLNFKPDKNTAGFSGGEKQRLYLAILLCMPFETILLDEPTSAMDHITSLDVLENIIRFCRNSKRQMLIISHSKELESKFSEQTIEISNEQTNK